VVLECYSALTRLPAGLAVTATVAAEILKQRFGGAPLSLSRAERDRLLARLAGAGVFGRATYDGVIALEADAHGERLLTLDRRAQATYQRLGVAFSVIAA
jgi:hypothetical protein